MTTAAKQPSPLAHAAAQVGTLLHALEKSFQTSCGLQLMLSGRAGAADAMTAIAVISANPSTRAIRRPIPMEQPSKLKDPTLRGESYTSPSPPSIEKPATPKLIWLVHARLRRCQIRKPPFTLCNLPLEQFGVAARPRITAHVRII